MTALESTNYHNSYGLWRYYNYNYNIWQLFFHFDRNQVNVNFDKTFTCIATGIPKPVRLDWNLGDAELDINDSQSETNNGADELVRQVGDKPIHTCNQTILD